MSLSHRFFSEALRDFNRAFALLEEPVFYHVARRSAIPARSFARQPATDLIETEEAFELRSELPGYDKKDIHIELIDDNTLQLRGSTHQESSAASESKAAEESKEVATSTPITPKWWVNERVSGNFQRSFSFPVSIKSEEIKASYENGVLKVIIPKANKETRRIQID
ncbi:HSP20-like chaperone [Rhizopus microsporus var. microsporus]|uniref:HSP20-like chaperone n=1 Tax=Rhizopus microsporus var. microsporus TaxID=86635 RepID=A0A1X0R5L0_RHIZD|nr:HSP20-like chaperone [Rhizopus microsporus var. microsporus]